LHSSSPIHACHLQRAELEADKTSVHAVDTKLDPQAEGWSARLITSLWRMGMESWVFRNGELYGKSTEEQYTKQLKEMIV